MPPRGGDRPGAPTITRYTTGVDANNDPIITIYWTAPANNGGQTVTHYEVGLGLPPLIHDSWQNVGDVLSYQLGGSINGVDSLIHISPLGNYYIGVRAVNASGAGSISNVPYVTATDV